jgi:hypothetical protein
MSELWLKCSACRKDLGFSTLHWICSVSTCNRNRTRLVFCSVACWDSHVATLRHREAWAVEARSPSREAWQAELAQEHKPEAAVAPSGAAAASSLSASATDAVRRRVIIEPPASTAPALAPDVEREVMVVVSKMKKYIRDRSGMNCSDAVAEMLSDHVRALCDDAIRTAATNGRKTVLERDVAKSRT